MKTSDKTISGILARMTWLLIGPALMIFLIVNAIVEENLSLELWIFYFVFCLVVIIGRFIDVKYMGGYNYRGQPSSVKEWRNFSFKYLLISTTVAGILIAVKQYGCTNF